ncbi:hypothetical protein FB45DRAFT_998101 [Roridomyces roridus]|uniref:Uncharacterized protein n=1 Tax=Roridomyces roridus TaxID=1738132 RepID=A0AAD7FZI1_9AGAR|nr:hypothetical protein FB45DRAFT_998101 [Roridomyces roridus]
MGNFRRGATTPAWGSHFGTSRYGATIPCHKDFSSSPPDPILPAVKPRTKCIEMGFRRSTGYGWLRAGGSGPSEEQERAPPLEVQVEREGADAGKGGSSIDEGSLAVASSGGPGHEPAPPLRGGDGQKQPGECVAVEDSKNGTLSAVRAGIPTVGYVGSYESEQQEEMRGMLKAVGADPVMADWAEFPTCLEAIEER